MMTAPFAGPKAGQKFFAMSLGTMTVQQEKTHGRHVRRITKAIGMLLLDRRKKPCT
jgi:hypothetical protein